MTTLAHETGPKRGTAMPRHPRVSMRTDSTNRSRAPLPLKRTETPVFETAASAGGTASHSLPAERDQNEYFTTSPGPEKRAALVSVLRCLAGLTIGCH